MELEQQLRSLIQQQLSLLELKTRNYIEWSQFRHVLQNELVIPVITRFVESIRDLEEENKTLVAKFNRASFQSDPARDNQILELHRQRLSNSQIGRIVGMTRQGVGRALKRLNGNSISSREKSG